ncbi:MAG: hypothetical protein QF910_09975, partial [Myxococcota bacterium]|nr:hypothetical protein [Myxococcota bacterium]
PVLVWGIRTRSRLGHPNPFSSGASEPVLVWGVFPSRRDLVSDRHDYFPNRSELCREVIRAGVQRRLGVVARRR